MINVDIWSDVRCPFCYIGKHNFESALKTFPQQNEVVVRWHSFQLDPTINTNPGQSSLDYFVQVKNVSEEQAREMFRSAEKMAEDVGLEMNLENSVLANSYRAHLLIQLAKDKGRANELEEVLFKAHLTNGRNIDDETVLLETAISAGLDKAEAMEALQSDAFAYAVKQDEMQAQQIGVKGVPFFVFNDKYAVSGAQPSGTFLEILEKVWQEKEKQL